MAFRLPDYLQKDRSKFYDEFTNDVTLVSNGVLYDFSAASFLRMFGEALALGNVRFNETQSEILPYIGTALVERLGITRSIGTKASVPVRFKLAAIFTQDFTILKGTRFGLTLNGLAIFETLNDLVIKANTDTSDPLQYSKCTIDAIAVDVGSNSNQASQQATILQPIQGLDSIWIDVSSNGGNDEETPDQYYDRVSLLIANFLEASYSLIQPSQFEQATKQILGQGSSAIAIPDLGSDGTSNQLASMFIFALNSDGTNLNLTQIRTLSEELSTKAPLVQGRLYFGNLTVTLVNAQIYIKVPTNMDQSAVANDINKKIRQLFNFEYTSQQQSIELYQIIHICYLAGALEPVAQIGIKGDLMQARNLPLPRLSPATNKTTPAKFERIVITIVPSNVAFTFTS